jgi:uncharacterized protein YbaP (TraB family)
MFFVFNQKRSLMSIFYKITSPNQKVSYLFGIVHTNDEDLVKLPLEVKTAFEQATCCVFEENMINLDEITKKYYELSTNWQNKQNIPKNKFPEDYALSVRTLNEIMLGNFAKKNPDIFSVYSHSCILKSTDCFPVAKALEMIDEFKMDNHQDKLVNMLGLQLMKNAEFKNKKIAYLEQIGDKYTASLGFNLNFQQQIEFYFFIASECLKRKNFFLYEDFVSAYLQQDSQLLSNLLRVYPATTSVPEPVRQYFDGISINRDLKMAHGMKSYLDNGNTFIAVGAGHLKGITDTLQTEGYKIEAVALGKRYYPIAGSIEDVQKVAAFRTIYTALYMSQSSFFKKRGFFPNDEMIVSLEQIKEYTSENKNTRSYKAWELAETHYKNVSSSNSELLKSICKESYAKSSSFFGLFRQTKTNLDNAERVADASPETRTGIVRDILNGSSI